MLHLYDRGHRDIAFLTGLTSSMQSDMRIRGYVAMLESLRLACGTDLLVEGSPDFSTSMDDGYALARRLWSAGKPFTGRYLCERPYGHRRVYGFHARGLAYPGRRRRHGI